MPDSWVFTDPNSKPDVALLLVASDVQSGSPTTTNTTSNQQSASTVTDTGFDADYGVMAATVAFGRNYSAGIVFPELSPIQIVPEPSTLVLLSGVLVWCAALRRRR